MVMLLVLLALIVLVLFGLGYVIVQVVTDGIGRLP